MANFEVIQRPERASKKITAVRNEAQKAFKKAGNAAAREGRRLTPRGRFRLSYVVILNTNQVEVKIKGSKKRVRIFNWVDKGTRPYKIRAKRGGFLRFQTGYRAITRRGGFSGGPGRAFGGWVSKKEVNHPGIKPRGFREEIAGVGDEVLQEELPKAVKRALK